jgi:periplasmic divalent cation tolerance protein
MRKASAAWTFPRGRNRLIMNSHFRLVLVTCATLREARKIARVIVSQRLAACVNIPLTPLESIYTWKAKVQTSREYLLLIKSVVNRLPKLEGAVKNLHSYDVPEFVVLPISAGSREYLKWLDECVKSSGTKKQASRPEANRALR